VANAPDLVQGKITVGRFAVIIAENMLGGGIATIISGKATTG
jgi:hypothetical protein